jgi:hemolysin III
MAVSGRRGQSLGEEIANSVSHGVGAVAAVAVAPFLVVDAAERGALAAASAGAFAASAFLLYLASTLYHALPAGRAKRVFQILDHSAIFLLIAGTYTPFALGALGGGRGWALFAFVWSLAAAGIVMKAVAGARHPRLSLGLYLALGWSVVLVADSVALRMPAAGLFWLVAGGLAYTAGVAFYAAERVRYGHFVWHLFVLGGTTCHVVAAFV